MIPMLMLLCSIAGFAGDPDSKAQKEVLAAMNQWKQAMLARDRSVLEEIFAPDLSYTHSSGKQESKAQAIEAIVNGKDRYESIEMTDTAVSIHGATALVKAIIVMRINTGETTTTLNLDVLHVWIKSASRWQLVARHATRLNP
jgi:ketosteroid isomerase-like protein